MSFNTLFAGTSRYTLLLATFYAVHAISLPGSAVAGELMMKDLEWHRRVLIMSAPSRQDPRWIAEEQALATWTGAQDRDVTVVRIEGSHVSVIAESGAELRRRYALPALEFAVALIGKDGHVALRSSEVLTGSQIDAAIDAMPMRRGGLR